MQICDLFVDYTQKKKPKLSPRSIAIQGKSQKQNLLQPSIEQTIF